MDYFRDLNRIKFVLVQSNVITVIISNDKCTVQRSNVISCFTILDPNVTETHRYSLCLKIIQELINVLLTS